MSTQEGIDELIARHKEALKKVEESKQFFKRRERAMTPKLPFTERLRVHLRTHSGTWGTVISTGCILVLSLRLVSLRRDFADAKGKLEAQQRALQEENTQLRSYVEKVEGRWEAILKEIRSGGWRSGSLLERVERIIDDTRPPKPQPEPTPKPKQSQKSKNLFI